MSDGPNCGTVDGKTRLLSEPCSSCITRPAGERIALSNQRVSQFIRQARAAESYVVCHNTLPAAATSAEPAVCRGFYDRYSTNALRLIERLWGFVEVDPPEVTA
jgi:hypothetical protein